MWKRLMSVLLVVLLCCPIFAVRAEEITADGRVNRALLVGCDRFLTQTDTTPSSRNNVLRMADALSGGTLNMQTIVTREDGLSSASALIALIRETFADADADDVSYFYISTHGLWNTAVNGLMTLLLSDGESEEGQVWEAAMFAAHKKLDNLCIFLDYNGLQIDGKIAEVNSPYPIAEKFKSFGWNVLEISAHSFDEIDAAFNAAAEFKGKPSVIVASSVKGKGVSFMEDQVGWHGTAPNAEQYEQAMSELNAALAELEA